jgi:Fe-S cluster assembly ATP-binding protein
MHSSIGCTYNSKQKFYNKPEADPLEFLGIINEKLKLVNMSPVFLSRNVNEGFSGGEKKRNEILQMILLKPSIAMLDEIDSGLDVDALQTVANAITKLKQEKPQAFLIISHYARLFEMIPPTRAVVMINGKIVIEGGKEIIAKIDGSGYEWIKKEYGISIEKENREDSIKNQAAMNAVSIGACATNESVKANVKK